MSTDHNLEKRPIEPFARTVPQDQADFDKATSQRQTETDVRSEARPDGRPSPDAPRGTATIANADSGRGSGSTLLDPRETDEFQNRWGQCQQHFVDEPKASVESADELVAEVMQKVAQQFSITREGLERQWAEGDSVSTEDLRLAMQKYREFFNRLLAA